MVKDLQENDDLIDKSVGKKIAALRKNRNMSQQVLSSKIGSSRQIIQKYETGEAKISISKLYKISKALHTNLNYFLENIEPKNTDQTNLNLIPSERISPLKVLLVEDKLSDGMITQRAIEKSNIEVEVDYVCDGVEALDFLRNENNEKPDLIFLDLNMPKVTGNSVLQEIKYDKSLKHIQVVVITNSNSMKEMQNLYKIGAAGYIVKSFNPDEYINKVSLTLDYWHKMSLPRM